MSLVKRLVGSRPFQRAVGFTAAEYLRLVWNTTRFTVVPEGIMQRAVHDFPAVVGVWHGEHYLAPLLRTMVGNYPFKVLVSRHRDGEINAIVAERLGMGVIRGSGSHGGGDVAKKGGVGAFYKMMSELERGSCVTMTADVPKVSRRLGRGIVRLAAASGRPLFVTSVATKNCLVLDTWDRTELNLPLGRGAIAVAGPFRIPRDADEAALEDVRRMIEAELNGASAKARAIVAGNGGGPGG